MVGPAQDVLVGPEEPLDLSRLDLSRGLGDRPVRVDRDHVARAGLAPRARVDGKAPVGLAQALLETPHRRRPEIPAAAMDRLGRARGVLPRAVVLGGPAGRRGRMGSAETSVADRGARAAPTPTRVEVHRHPTRRRWTPFRWPRQCCRSGSTSTTCQSRGGRVALAGGVSTRRVDACSAPPGTPRARARGRRGPNPSSLSLFRLHPVAGRAEGGDHSLRARPCPDPHIAGQLVLGDPHGAPQPHRGYGAPGDCLTPIRRRSARHGGNLSNR